MVGSGPELEHSCANKFIPLALREKFSRSNWEKKEKQQSLNEEKEEDSSFRITFLHDIKSIKVYGVFLGITISTSKDLL